MAKSSRASSIKSNNQRLKNQVFGPAEAARTERLSQKLRELAEQSKPQRDEDMEHKDQQSAETEKNGTTGEDIDAMDIDASRPKKKPLSKKAIKRKGIEKRRANSKVIFQKTGPRRLQKKK